jgi:hypothetical protein
MSEMIERVKLAIRDACDPHVTDSMCEVAARAAIEAMREPTEAMLQAFGERALPIGNPQDGYSAMIDEALK